MKTGQMLFVAFGGALLGAAGTLAVQTGLVHYEISLDIRPRGAVTLPPPGLASTAGDPYLSPHAVQNWEPVPPAEALPVTLPPLDDQQIAEIVELREQIGRSQGVIMPTECEGGSDNQAFAENLRAAAGINNSALPPDSSCPECCEESRSVARGLRQGLQR